MCETLLPDMGWEIPRKLLTPVHPYHATPMGGFKPGSASKDAQKTFAQLKKPHAKSTTSQRNQLPFTQ